MENKVMSDQFAVDVHGVKTVGTVDPATASSPLASPSGSEPVAVRPSEVPNEEPGDMVPSAQLAQATPQPGPDNLPSADSIIARQAAELGLKVVDAERDGANLYLVVEGKSVEDVQGFDSRKLAYDARFHYGFDNAGIEPHAGAEPVRGTSRYRQTWKLTRGI